MFSRGVVVRAGSLLALAFAIPATVRAEEEEPDEPAICEGEYYDHSPSSDHCCFNLTGCQVRRWDKLQTYYFRNPTCSMPNVHVGPIGGCCS